MQDYTRDKIEDNISNEITKNNCSIIKVNGSNVEVVPNSGYPKSSSNIMCGKSGSVKKINTSSQNNTQKKGFSDILQERVVIKHIKKK